MRRPEPGALDAQMRALREAGFGALACLLEPAEAEEMGLAGEGEAARAAGLDFIAFPIPDRGVPQGAEAAASLIAAIRAHLGEGRGVAIHCRAGVGRSGLIAAALLVSTGAEPGEAFETVRAARHVTVPDTSAQRVWLEANAGAFRG